MIQNEKDLLLKDLCSRIPYGVKISIDDDIQTVIGQILYNDDYVVTDKGCYSLKNVVIKPYLFPLNKISGDMWSEYLATCVGGNASFPTLKSFDWCNKHHIDYRGLIPKGLANDATGLNIY